MHIRRPTKLLALTLVLTAALTTPALAQSPDDKARIWLPMVPQQRSTELGSLGGRGGVAYALNNQNQVTGMSVNAAGEIQPFVWSPATGMQQIGGNNVSGAGHAINNQGHVAGTLRDSSNRSHAFLWSQAQGLQNLGTLGGDYAEAYSINDQNQIVGFATVTGGHEAFIWQPQAGMRSLGTLGGRRSVAYDINNAGQEVRSYATDINDHGNVVGATMQPEGYNRPTLWGTY